MSDEVSKKSIVDIANETMARMIKELSGANKEGNSKRIIDNMVAFMGASGGVGTSTIVADLASSLVKAGYTVLLVDMNIQYPVQHIFFNVKQAISKKDLASFAMGKNSIGESIVNTNGLSLLSANNRTIMDYINCDERACAKNLLDAIDKIRYLYDFIIFDCPLLIDFDMVNAILYKCDALYLVWDESLSCISNTDRIRRNLQATGIEHLQKTRVVFNKRTNIHYPKYPFDQLKLDVLEVLPFDTAIIESGLRGEVFTVKGESLSKNARAYVSGIHSLRKKVLEIGGYTE